LPRLLVLGGFVRVAEGDVRGVLVGFPGARPENPDDDADEEGAFI